MVRVINPIFFIRFLAMKVLPWPVTLKTGERKVVKVSLGSDAYVERAAFMLYMRPHGRYRFSRHTPHTKLKHFYSVSFITQTDDKRIKGKHI